MLYRGELSRSIRRHGLESCRVHPRIDGQNRPVVINTFRCLGRRGQRTENQQRGEWYRVALSSPKLGHFAASSCVWMV
jgi:hypothetical protein